MKRVGVVTALTVLAVLSSLVPAERHRRVLPGT